LSGPHHPHLSTGEGEEEEDSALFDQFLESLITGSPLEEAKKVCEKNGQREESSVEEEEEEEEEEDQQRVEHFFSPSSASSMRGVEPTLSATSESDAPRLSSPTALLPLVSAPVVLLPSVSNCGPILPSNCTYRGVFSAEMNGERRVAKMSFVFNVLVEQR
jgi:hypothetical protein